MTVYNLTFTSIETADFHVRVEREELGIHAFVEHYVSGGFAPTESKALQQLADKLSETAKVLRREARARALYTVKESAP